MALYIKYRAKNGQGWARWPTNAIMTRFMAGPPPKNRMGQPGPLFTEKLRKRRHDGVSRLAHHLVSWPTLSLTGPPLHQSTFCIIKCIIHDTISNALNIFIFF